MPSRVLCDRATPITAQPSLTSSSMTARPRLRAPNTTALRCLACVSLIGSLDSLGVSVRTWRLKATARATGHRDRRHAAGDPSITVIRRCLLTYPAAKLVVQLKRNGDSVSTEQRETLDAILRQSAFPDDSDVNEQRRLLRELL